MKFHRFLRTKRVPRCLRGKLILASDSGFDNLADLVTKRRVTPTLGLAPANHYGLSILDLIVNPTAGKIMQALLYGVRGIGATNRAFMLEEGKVHLIPPDAELDSALLRTIQARNLPRARPVLTLDGSNRVVSREIPLIQFMDSETMPEFPAPANYSEFIARQLLSLHHGSDPAALQNLLSAALRMNVEADLVSTSSEDVRRALGWYNCR